MPQAMISPAATHEALQYNNKQAHSLKGSVQTGVRLRLTLFFAPLPLLRTHGMAW